jgi:hypothetical protein
MPTGKDVKGEKMRRLLTAGDVIAALAVPFGASHVASVHAAPAPPKCPPGQYKMGKCPTPNASGTLSIALAGTQVKLAGKATPATRSTPVSISRVTVSGVAAHAQAFRIFAPRAMPTLHLVTKGTLYRLNVKTNKWSRVSSITGSGIYQAVFR